MFLACFDHRVRLGLAFTLGLITHSLANAQPLSSDSPASDSLTVGTVTDQASTHSESGIVLKQNDRQIAIYNESVVPNPGDDARWYDRSGFVHPFRAPSGRIVTAAFPPDHRHQHGLMFAWTSSQVGGRSIDFWNSHRRQGHVEHVRTVSKSPTRVEALLHHVDDTVAPAKVILEETWDLNTVPHPCVHILDLQSAQVRVTEEAFVIQKYHYGAMCVRGADQWSGKASMLTSESKSVADGNHSRPVWVAMYGLVDGAVCGIAAISHPSNFRYPQHVRLHPKMPYFCYFPAVEADFEIKADEVYRSRFRFVAFDGQPDAALLDSLSDEFADRDW